MSTRGDLGRSRESAVGLPIRTVGVVGYGDTGVLIVRVTGLACEGCSSGEAGESRAVTTGLDSSGPLCQSRDEADAESCSLSEALSWHFEIEDCGSADACFRFFTEDNRRFQGAFGSILRSRLFLG